MAASFLAASSSIIGGRQSQEDRISCVENLNIFIPKANRSELDPARSLFCVFDGHGGHGCSEFLAKKFYVELARSPLLRSDPKAALLEVWKTLDGQFYALCMQKAAIAMKKDVASKALAKAVATPAVGAVASAAASAVREAEEAKLAAASFPRDGSTATVLLLVGKKLFAANCGDSAGILVRKNGSVKVLTKDHSTLNPLEFERVYQSGGSYREQTAKVQRKWPMCCAVRETVVGKPRVYPGGLLVTRSFGDFSAKVPALGGKPGVILPNCEEVVEMTVEDDWAEVVIATDGVWDVVPNEDMPLLLAQLEGTKARGTALELSPRAVANTIENSCGKVRGRLGRISEEEPPDTDEETRSRQAQLTGTCAKLVLSCVRDRYWGDNQAVADNASAVILRFFSPEPRGTQANDRD